MKYLFPDEREKFLEKENKRTEFEWTEFQKTYPQDWDEMPEEGKKLALELVERQAKRSLS